jgi:hypothetical protein
MGRYNRWQNKITPPCKNNPMNKFLSVEYSNEQLQSRLSRTTKTKENDMNVPSSNAGAIIVSSAVKENHVDAGVSTQLHTYQEQQEQQQKEQLDEMADHEQVSLSSSFLNDLDSCPLSHHDRAQCSFLQQEPDTSSLSFSKRTKVNDEGGYSGGLLLDEEEGCHDEIDETCDEIKKLLLGECHEDDDDK